MFTRQFGRLFRRLWLVPRSWILWLTVTCLPNAITCSADMPAGNWLQDEALQKQLALPSSVTWSGRPLRTALESLAGAQHVATWIDRRLDPGRELDISANGIPLREILDETARTAGGRVGQVGSVLYWGPAETAELILTVAAVRTEETQAWPAELRQRWLAARPIQWPLLTEPKRLLSDLAAETGFTIAKLDSLPHDLWPTADLPPLTVPERLTLILAGFGYTYRADPSQRTIDLVPWPTEAQWTKTYAQDPVVNRAVAELQRRRPAVLAEKTGNRWKISGLVEDHQLLKRLGTGEPTRPPAGKAEHRYSLSIKNVPLEALLQRIEAAAGLKRVVSPTVGTKLQQRVSVDVKEATLEKLLEAAFDGTGLRFSIQSGELRIDG